MRTVQKGNLSFVIWGFAWNEEHIQTSLVCREFLCYGFWCLDNPQMEYLTFHYKIVLVSYALVDLVYRILRIARNDTVNEGAIDSASLLKPFLEAVAKLPEVDVLIDAFLEFLAIEEDKLARKNDESLGHIALEMLISVIKKLGKLAWI